MDVAFAHASAQRLSPPPPDLRGTAFGCFKLASGVAVLLPASVVWDQFGTSWTFIVGGGFAVGTAFGAAMGATPAPPA